MEVLAVNPPLRSNVNLMNTHPRRYRERGKYDDPGNNVRCGLLGLAQGNDGVQGNQHDRQYCPKCTNEDEGKDSAYPTTMHALVVRILFGAYSSMNPL